MCVRKAEQSIRSGLKQGELMVVARLRNQELGILFIMLLDITVWLWASPLYLCFPVYRIYSVCAYIYYIPLILLLSIRKLQTKMKPASRAVTLSPFTILLSKEQAQKTHLDRLFP